MLRLENGSNRSIDPSFPFDSNTHHRSSTLRRSGAVHFCPRLTDGRIDRLLLKIPPANAKFGSDAGKTPRYVTQLVCVWSHVL